MGVVFHDVAFQLMFWYFYRRFLYLSVSFPGWVFPLMQYKQCNNICLDIKYMKEFFSIFVSFIPFFRILFINFSLSSTFNKAAKSTFLFHMQDCYNKGSFITDIFLKQKNFAQLYTIFIMYRLTGICYWCIKTEHKKSCEKLENEPNTALCRIIRII